MSDDHKPGMPDQPPGETPPESEEAQSPADAAAERPDPIGDIGDAARDIAATFRRVNSRLLIGILLGYAIAAGVTVGTVLMNPVRDWFLFVGMFLVILAYMTAYIKAHQRQRRILRIISLVSTEVLLAFWGFILIDRIPERKVFVDGAVQVREAMAALWLPVALLGVVGLGLLVHWAWAGHLQKRAA